MNPKVIKSFALFIVLILFLRMSVLAVFSWSSILYYAMLLVFLLVEFLLYTKSSPYPPNKFLLCLLTVGALSIVLNDVMPEFQPWMRWLGFVVISLTFGPILVSYEGLRLKIHICEMIKNIGIIFCVVSLFLKFAGFTLIVPTAFGISYHDMTIAPIAFICSILILDDYFLDVRHKTLKLLSFLLCMACGFMTGSRAAIGSYLFALSLYFILSFKGFKKYMYIGILGGFLWGIYTINPWGLLNHFFEKMNRDSEDVSFVLSGRDKMIQDRIEDFKCSPIYGVGFASMKNIANSKVRFDEGKIESGSSWFLIIGSTGLVGLLFFILSIFYAVRKSISPKMNIPIISCIFFFLSHIMVEGYIFSFGAPLCAIFWLFVSIAESEAELYIFEFKNY